MVLHVGSVALVLLERLVRRRKHCQLPQFEIGHGYRVLFDEVVKLENKREKNRSISVSAIDFKYLVVYMIIN